MGKRTAGCVFPPHTVCWVTAQGPGFEPGASRSRSAVTVGSPVSWRLLQCPPELDRRFRRARVPSQVLLVPRFCDPAVTRQSRESRANCSIEPQSKPFLVSDAPDNEACGCSIGAGAKELLRRSDRTHLRGQMA